MRAARRLLTDLDAAGLLGDVAGVRADLYGSLGSTGRGHHSDRAVQLGLLGEQPETVDPLAVEPILQAVRSGRRLALLGRHTIDFDPVDDIVLHRRQTLSEHPNGMRFRCYDGAGKVLAERVMFSVGGGFVVDADELRGQTAAPDDPCPYPFATGDQLLAICAANDLTIEQVVWANETATHAPDEVRAGVLGVWAVMQECIRNGFGTDGRLPGGLNVLRRAPLLYRKLASDGPDALTGMDWITAYALAVNEENAAGGRVVTAPTNGAAGVIPAVLHYYRDHVPGADDDGVVRFLLTATAIGVIIKTTASISGAEVGCQGEVGSACAMAAAGLAAVMGGTPKQVENAAEIGMEHNLGLTCDPVGGLVQVPCIERNAIAAVKAVAAARTAMHFDGNHLVSLDTVVKTMRDTGADMMSKYKETSEGGLAVNVTEC